MYYTVIARFGVVGAPRRREALLSEDVESEAFIQRMFYSREGLPAAVLLGSDAGMLLRMSHHVAAQKFVVLVEVRLKQKDSA